MAPSGSSSRPAKRPARSPARSGSGTGRSRPARKRRSLLWRYRRLLFLAVLLVVMFLSGVGVLLARVPLPAEDFVPESTFIFDADGNRLAVLHAGENRVAVSLADVPQVVVDAVVAAEDDSFFRHSGLDPVGIARATWADIRAGATVQGGSTITQQYVKNRYVGSERTLWRKLKEAALAVKLERKLSKDEILERYLNTIYFGRGAYGVQAAAKAWFDKDVTELGLPEAAYLAGLIRAPETADVSKDPERAAARRLSVLAAMERQGLISAADREAVDDIPLTSYVVDRASLEPQVVGADIGTQYFVEHVRQQLVETYKSATVYGGGLRVYTTLDPDLQRSAYEAVYGVLDRPDDPAAALVSVDAGGAVRAMVGGRDWEASKVNLAVGADGGGGGRQAGSSFKPFVLAEAVRQGWSLESSFESPSRIVLPKANDGKDWKVSNYDGSSHGRVNLVEATRVSSNTAYAQLVMAVGADEVAELANRMGIRSELPPVNSIVLGTPTVSVLDMAGAYLTFATRGVAVESHVITRIETADGRVLFEERPERTRVLDETEADVVNFALANVVRHGTGQGAALPVPVAGKTGTTQGYGDAWFVGYTRTLSTAVWMGYPEGQARPLRGVRGIDVTGGSFPATIFRRFMTAATAGTSPGGFRSFTSFPGEVHGERVDYVDPAATTTTGPSTTTTAPDPAATTTTAKSAPTTTAPPPPTSAPPTTAPATTTTTERRGPPNPVS